MAPGTAARPLRFRRGQRLTRKSEFDAAFANGRRIADALFVLTVRTPAASEARAAPRLGLAIAAKTIGNAVARNRVRRTVRETFRLAQRRLPPLDIVVSARAAARDAERARMRASLEQLWSKVSRQCAPSSAG